jgi:hypothetical protein
MVNAPTTVRSTISLLKILSFGDLGFLFKMSSSPGSKASATSWIPFVTKFYHQI